MRWVAGESEVQVSEEGDRAGEESCKILEETLASNDVYGHNSANVGDNQRECVLEVVMRSFLKGDFQRRRF